MIVSCMRENVNVIEKKTVIVNLNVKMRGIRKNSSLNVNVKRRKKSKRLL